MGSSALVYTCSSLYLHSICTQYSTFNPSSNL